jgi:hypothetical protein
MPRCQKCPAPAAGYFLVNVNGTAAESRRCDQCWTFDQWRGVKPFRRYPR